MNLFARLDEATRQAGLSFLLIGGNAVNAHGFGRTTKDVDLLICVADSEKWVNALESDGYQIEHHGNHFLQLSAAAKDSTPVDFMLVNPATFAQMKAAATTTTIDNYNFLVPSLEHLLALKFHALKHGPSQRGYKDLVDVLSLIDANGIDVRGDKFRALCDKYGNKEIYERIIAFGQR